MRYLGAALAGGVLVFSLSSPVAVVAQEVLRGQVRIDLEPVYARYADVPYPLDTATAHSRALEEASLSFSGMIYGWAFDYDIGERVRDYEERFELFSQGTIPPGDPRMTATDAEVRDMRLFLWVDYRPDEAQARRLAAWKMGAARRLQGTGTGALAGPPDPEAWRAGKQEALEDAARAAIRSFLRSTERNRPKECRGFIALEAFPTYRIVAGRWTAVARFKVEISELVPFPAY